MLFIVALFFGVRLLLLILNNFLYTVVVVWEAVNQNFWLNDCTKKVSDTVRLGFKKIQPEVLQKHPMSKTWNVHSSFLHTYDGWCCFRFCCRTNSVTVIQLMLHFLYTTLIFMFTSVLLWEIHSKSDSFI